MLRAAAALFYAFLCIPYIGSLRLDLKRIGVQVAGAIGSVFLTTSPPNNVELPYLSTPPTYAAIAPLADVGVREFLVKDGRQFLRLNIPEGEKGKFGRTANSADMKIAQENLELVRLVFEQVGFTNPSAWGTALKDANMAANSIKALRPYLTNGDNTELKEKIFDERLVPSISQLMEGIRTRDIFATLAADEAAGETLAQLRLMELPPHQLPFKIPDEYSTLPRLLGRATIELVIQSNSGGIRLADGKTVVKQVPLTLVVDGYHTPITAGNFVNLVNQKFYDGMNLQKVEELIIQTGKPDASVHLRPIPLELFYKTDSKPVYGITSDDDLRATETFAYPFQAYGALGMARDNEETDSGTSEFFFLKWMQALIAPGRNTLDGFYSCFGYVTKNEDLLKQVTAQDKIVYAKVVDGLDNLVVP